MEHIVNINQEIYGPRGKDYHAASDNKGNKTQGSLPELSSISTYVLPRKDNNGSKIDAKEPPLGLVQI